jgi:phage replication-related protein YjqB (UPF0714/DUF867 family)
MSDVPDARSYRDFADLAQAQQRSRDYVIHVSRRPSSGVAIIAPHGGEIENGTSEVARAIAGDDFNLYLFEGIRPSKNFRALHLTSHRFDEPECLSLVAAATAVVAIHGCGGEDRRVFLGGLDVALCNRLGQALVDADVDAPTTGHRFPARHARNVCNRGATGRGVQIELTGAMRAFPAAQRVVDAIRPVLLALDDPRATLR